MKKSNQKPKQIRKHGNTPVYMRNEVTAHMLREYPQYKKIFFKCPNCGRYSLKPIGLHNIDKVTEVLDTNERKCTICPYTHVRDLAVSTIPTSKAAIEGRILYYVNAKIT